MRDALYAAGRRLFSAFANGEAISHGNGQVTLATYGVLLVISVIHGIDDKNIFNQQKDSCKVCRAGALERS